MGSALYEKGIRWTELVESVIGKHEINYMVLDNISMINDYPCGPYHKYRNVDHNCGFYSNHFNVDHNHHFSGAWSHELQRKHPAGKQHELNQHEPGENHFLSISPM